MELIAGEDGRSVSLSGLLWCSFCIFFSTSGLLGGTRGMFGLGPLIVLPIVPTPTLDCELVELVLHVIDGPVATPAGLSVAWPEAR
eukprot:COSAG02_NODE_44443_length_366_cov_0.767790_1_plen_85_part_10